MKTNFEADFIRNTLLKNGDIQISSDTGMYLSKLIFALSKERDNALDLSEKLETELKIYHSDDIVEAHNQLYTVHSHTDPQELLARDAKGVLVMVKIKDITKHWFLTQGKEL